MTINPAALTVTITDTTKVYGQDDHTTLSGVVAGLLGTDTATASYASTGSVSTADVGSYAIYATLAAGGSTKLSDYAVAYTNKAGTKTTGTLTITQAAPTVTLSAANATYTASAYAGALTTTVNGSVTTSGITYTYYSGPTNLGSTAPKGRRLLLGRGHLCRLDRLRDGHLDRGPLHGHAGRVDGDDQRHHKVYGQDDTPRSRVSSPAAGHRHGHGELCQHRSVSTADVGSYAITATLVAGGSTKLSDYAATYNLPGRTKTTSHPHHHPAAPTVTLSAATATYTASAYAGSLTTTVNGNATTAGISYTYYSGSTNLGVTPPKDAGSYTVAATYAGSTDYSSATSRRDSLHHQPGVPDGDR